MIPEAVARDLNTAREYVEPLTGSTEAKDALVVALAHMLQAERHAESQLMLARRVITVLEQIREHERVRT